MDAFWHRDVIPVGAAGANQADHLGALVGHDVDDPVRQGPKGEVQPDAGAGGPVPNLLLAPGQGALQVGVEGLGAQAAVGVEAGYEQRITGRGELEARAVTLG